MPLSKDQRRSACLAALADPTRRAILELLSRKRLHVEELAGHFPVSRPAVSKHLRTLKQAGLLRESHEGRRAFYAVNPKPLAEVEQWLAMQRQVWETSLAKLKRLVERDD
ncbi:ArsR/SmtB family transcription factor [Piscinibacter sp.]|uniref:ArsR/SmtB family transcription factor n=1 Tax=Piscinibacter sp. TaxID=1903157 RepID=UPI002C71C994|nr:metalloregulator ArsR/SmtB family transcription factor [Albitalea sp.]HUG22524.1 metalloregulator ArsR/SmtB family transcription factor [Albitalea sp.]